MFRLLLLILFSQVIVPVITNFDVPLISSEVSQLSNQGCTSGQFECPNGGCISNWEICDEVDDCLDNSDEKPYLCTEYGDAEPPGLVFAVDVTPTMENELPFIVNTTQKILNSISSREKMVENFKFIIFTDKTVWPPQDSEEIVQFKNFLRNNMTTKDGSGRSKTLVLTAIQNALNFSAPKSKIFVFVDANPKDVHLLPSILTLLESKKSQIIIFLLAAVGPGREYKKITSLNAGQTLNVFFEDLNKFQNFIEWMAEPYLENLFAVDVEDIHYGANRYNYSCQIPENVTDLTFVISSLGYQPDGNNKTTFNLTDESGRAVSQSSVVSSRETTVVRMKNPKFKKLIINVFNRPNPYSIRVTGSSKVDMDFVYGFSLTNKWTGFRPEFSRLPFKDSINYLFLKPTTEARSREKVIPVLCLLKSSEHDFIERLDLQKLPNSKDGTYYAEYDTTHSSGFYLKVRGSTGNNSFFDEVISSVLEPSSEAIMLSVPEDKVILQPNMTVKLTCHLECLLPTSSHLLYWKKNGEMMWDTIHPLKSSETIFDYTVQFASVHDRDFFYCSVLRATPSWINSNMVYIDANNISTTTSTTSPSTLTVTRSSDTTTMAATTTTTMTTKASSSTTTTNRPTSTTDDGQDQVDTSPLVSTARGSISQTTVAKKPRNSRTNHSSFSAVRVIVLLMGAGVGIFIITKYFKRRIRANDHQENESLSYLRFSKSCNSLEKLEPSH